MTCVWFPLPTADVTWLLDPAPECHRSLPPGDDSSEAEDEAADAEVTELLSSRAVRRGAKAPVAGPGDVNPFELAEPSSSSSGGSDEDSDEGLDDEEVEAPQARGGKRRSKDLSSDFAPLEEYAHLLDGPAEAEPGPEQVPARAAKQSKRRRK